VHSHCELGNGPRVVHRLKPFHHRSGPTWDEQALNMVLFVDWSQQMIAFLRGGSTAHSREAANLNKGGRPSLPWPPPSSCVHRKTSSSCEQRKASSSPDLHSHCPKVKRPHGLPLPPLPVFSGRPPAPASSSSAAPRTVSACGNGCASWRARGVSHPRPPRTQRPFPRCPPTLPASTRNWRPLGVSLCVEQGAVEGRTRVQPGHRGLRAVPRGASRAELGQQR